MQPRSLRRRSRSADSAPPRALCSMRSAAAAHRSLPSCSASPPSTASKSSADYGSWSPPDSSPPTPSTTCADSSPKLVLPPSHRAASARATPPDAGLCSALRTMPAKTPRGLRRRQIASPNESAPPRTPPPAASKPPAGCCCARYGIVFRELLARETNLPIWRELQWAFRRLEERGQIRGGRFVSGFVGEQFALPARGGESARTPQSACLQRTHHHLRRRPVEPRRHPRSWRTHPCYRSTQRQLPRRRLCSWCRGSCTAPVRGELRGRRFRRMRSCCVALAGCGGWISWSSVHGQTFDRRHRLHGRRARAPCLHRRLPVKPRLLLRLGVPQLSLPWKTS